jgi:hypothetical protein
MHLDHFLLFNFFQLPINLFSEAKFSSFLQKEILNNL